jgi:hypothetical protein
VTDTVADLLVDYPGGLSFNGARQVSDRAIAGLAGRPRGWLSLDRLPTISLQAAQAVGRSGREIRLRGLGPLPAETVAALRANPAVRIGSGQGQDRLGQGQDR